MSNDNFIGANPLCWPAGWKRLGEFQHRDPSRFIIKNKKGGSLFSSIRDGLIHELELLKVKDNIISTNIPLRQDGLPYAKFSQPKDPGVAVYFTLNGKQMVFACDEYPKVEENMQAIRKTIEAIRGIKRWGASDMLERAFTGFKALESPQPESCWSILQIKEGSPKGAIALAWKSMAKKYHPDIKGGSNEMMTKINTAYDECMENINDSK